MISAVLLFILGFVFLIKGGDWFVDGATGIAERFHLPELLIGATVVSIGTTLPEVMVSATSAVSGHGEIAYGNAIGSIICNVSLIAALTIAVKPSKVDAKTFRTPVLFFFAAAAIYAAVAYVGGYFSRPVGIVLLLIFIVYMFITVRSAINNPTASAAEQETESKEDNTKDSEKTGKLSAFKATLPGQLVLLIIGAAIIAIGADLLVDNGTIIAKYFGVPESVIALTFVALGTSLPELVTAVTSLIKGHGALSLGNIVGANLFNLVLVSGLSITLNPFSIPTEKVISVGGAMKNASLVIDMPLMILVMAFLTIPALIKGELKRYQGIVLLIVYASFCIFQFV